MINIDYLIRTNRRSVSITISPKCEVIVKAPRKLPFSEIERIVAKKENWINMHIDKIRENATLHYNIENYIDILFLGQIYHIAYDDSAKTISLEPNYCVVPQKYADTVVRRLTAWYKRTCYDILKKSQCKGVIHCFSGNIENAKMYISIGFSLGIGGVLTFQNSKLKDVIKDISIDKIVSETDSPYLAPVPYRGTKNEPKNIPIIVEEIAKHKKLNIEEVRSKIEQNVKEIFNI